MHLHDVIFLGLALFIVILTLTTSGLLSPRSTFRKALVAPVRALARSRDNERVGS